MFPRNEQVKNTRGKPKMLSKLSIYLLRGDGLSRNALKNSYEKKKNRKSYDEHKFGKFIVPGKSSDSDSDTDSDTYM